MDFYTRTKQFSLKEISPKAKQLDEDAVFPKEIFDKLGSEGYFSLLIPEAYGGEGKGLSEHAQVCMALAESSATVGLCYMMHNVALMCINNHGDESLKQKIFTDVVKNKKLLALAYSELGTGTHFYKPEISAKYTSTGVTLNGTKSMVTSANYASYYLVLSPAKEGEKLNNWIVPLEAKGLTFLLSQWDGLGMRANVSCPMEMTDLFLENEYKIGEDGSGIEQVFATVAPFFLTGLASVYSGLSADIYQEALQHATTRKYAQDLSLSHIETVQIHLSRLYTKMVGTRTLTFEAARSYDNQEADAVLKIIAARIFASEGAIESATIAMRVGGGKSYNKQTSLERLLRDSFASHIMAPSVDVLNIWLGKAVSGQQIP
ncbi:MAG: acyl-CoA/acyl-ACP dehydrogenase [Campylobacterales bacterium]|nr:acyl-CoA/acyl-ACP dehydrogenase [Campylobacterales bacterium]